MSRMCGAMAKTWSDIQGELAAEFKQLHVDFRAAQKTRDEARAAWDTAQALFQTINDRLNECRAKLEAHLRRAGDEE